MHVLFVLVVVAVVAATAPVAAARLRAVQATIQRPGSITVAIVDGKPFNVMDYGAKGDGKNDDTSACQAALDAAWSAGGGTVEFPSGFTFLSFALTSNSSRTEWRIDGTLLVNNDRDKWPGSLDFITVTKASNVAFTGSGSVRGQGEVWWAHRDDFRPRLLYLHDCDTVLLDNLTFQNSPNHNIEAYSDHTEVSGITILAPPSTAIDKPSHNTDGIDVHGTPFHIHDSYISTGDDNVAMHANATLVEHCFFGTGHGASIGSVGSGTWLHNITVANVVFNSTTTGARIKTDSGAKHGCVQNVTYANLTMTNVGTTIDVTMNYDSVATQAALDSDYLTIKDVSFVNIHASRSGAPGEFACAHDAPCEGLLLDNVVHTDTPGDWECQHAHGQVKGTVTPKPCLQSR